MWVRTSPLEEALKAYRSARAHWAEVVDVAKGVYAPDLSASDRFSERGQWLDRFAGIDQDIARLEQRLASAQETQDQRLEAAIAEILTRPRRASAKCHHEPPVGFQPQEPVDIALSIEGRQFSSVRLYYRHVNQAERFQRIEMERGPRGYRIQIPGAYTDSPYLSISEILFRQGVQYLAQNEVTRHVEVTNVTRSPKKHI